MIPWACSKAFLVFAMYTIQKEVLIKLSTQYNKPPQFIVYCLTTIIDKASHGMSKSLNINNTIDQTSHTMSKIVGQKNQCTTNIDK